MGRDGSAAAAASVPMVPMPKPMAASQTPRPRIIRAKPAFRAAQRHANTDPVHALCHAERHDVRSFDPSHVPVSLLR